MTIVDLWYLTMNDPNLSVRWAAIGVLVQFIQTLFIVFSAAVVIFQIRQFQKDAIEKKITGFKTAVEALDNDLFNQVSKQATSGRVIQGVNWRKLLNTVNLVAILVQEGYTNSQLLLALKGKDLYAVSNYIQKNGLPDELKDDLDDQFKPAISFLNDINAKAKKLGYTD